MDPDNLPQVDESGTVTLNVGVNTDLPAVRSRNQKRSPEKRYGNCNGANDLNVAPYDLLMTLLEEKLSLSYSSKMPVGFASLAGLMLRDGETQTSFRAQFRPLGFAKGPYIFGPGGSPGQSVAAITRGKLTVRNNGHTEIRVGDRVAWDLLPIDREEYARAVADMPLRAQSASNEKAVPRLVRADYNDTRMAAEAVDWAINHPEDSKATDVHKKADSVTQLGVAIKQEALSMLLFGVTALLKAKVLTFNRQDLLPQNARNGTEQLTDAQSYNETHKVLDGFVKEFEKQALPAQNDVTLDTEIKTLARLLGLIDDQGPEYQQHIGLQQAVLKMQLRSLRRQGAQEPQYHIEKYIKPASQQEMRGNSTDKQISSLQRSFGRTALQAYQMHKEEIDGRVLGFAVRHAMPGNKFDLVM